MKKISLFIMLFCLTSGLAIAQKSVKKEMVVPEARAQKMTERMVKELSLDEQQAKQIQVLNLQMAKQMNDRKSDLNRKELCDSCKKIIKERKGDRQRKHSEFKEARESRNNQLKKILTKDQYELYMKNMKEHAGKAQKNSARR